MMNQPDMFSNVSLFSGAGGLDFGLEGEGFVTRVSVEIDRDAQETLRRNRNLWREPDAPILGDITKLSPGEILAGAGVRVGEATLLAGGAPCQSFSTAGRRGSVSDPRGGLFAHFARVAAGVRPRFFVFENVRGILSAAVRHRPLHLRGSDSPGLDEDEELGSALRKLILPTFRETLGYEVVYGLVNSADYGVPQIRERVIFIGSRDRELGSDRWPFLEMAIARLMPPTHADDPSRGLPPWLTLGDALCGLRDENPEFTPYSPARRAVLELVPAGKNWRHLRDTYGPDFLKEVMGGAYDSSGGRVGFWRRLDFSRPCPTVPASPIQKGTCLCHPVEIRPLSVREYARVQGFPDACAFSGSTSSKYRQIGNAVPVGLGRAIGRAIRGVIEGQVRVAEEHAAYAAATT